MTRRTTAVSRVIVAGVAATVAMAVTAQATPARRGDRCARAGSYTFMQTKLVRVYAGSRPVRDAIAYACDRRTGRRSELGVVDTAGRYLWGGRRATAIRGSWIAFSGVTDPDMDEGPSIGEIHMVHLPAGAHPWANPPTIRYDAVDSIESMNIAPNRTLAYTMCVNYNNEPDRCVRPLDNPRVIATPYDAARHSFGTPVVLDQGPGIDTRSLRLSPSGKRLAWTHDGQTRTAPVP